MCVVSATPLWAPWGARRSRAELSLPPKEIWLSSRNGGVRSPAGCRIIAPAGEAAPSPICKRIFLSRPILPTHSNPLAQERRLLRPAPSKQTRGARRNRNERFEISIPKLETASAANHAQWPIRYHPVADSAHAHLHAVASLRERRRAAIVDVGLLLFSYGGMLALFTVLGGHVGFNKLDLTVVGATFALFYAQYFALFTVFGGSTPGMMLRGLRVLGFDGGMPTSRQMVWRSVGYLISAATCFLGFVWALWDDDQLTWQDRISQTYVTPIEESRAN